MQFKNNKTHISLFFIAIFSADLQLQERYCSFSAFQQSIFFFSGFFSHAGLLFFFIRCIIMHVFKGGYA